jgi:hypothetical protein
MASEAFGPDSPYSEPRDGYLFLGQAVLWVATEGGRLDREEAITRFDFAEQRVFEQLGRGALVAEGVDREGKYVPISSGNWPLASSDYEPGRPTVTYPDRIGGDLSGTLEIGRERWVGIRVQKADVARLWQFDPRDTLITWVARGALKPADAEVEAARLGVAPLLSDPGELDPAAEPLKRAVEIAAEMKGTLSCDCRNSARK